MKESIKIQTVQDQKYISTTFFKCIHPFLSKRQQLGHCFAAWVFCFLIIFFIKEVSDVSHNYLCSMTKHNVREAPSLCRGTKSLVTDGTSPQSPDLNIREQLRQPKPTEELWKVDWNNQFAKYPPRTHQKTPHQVLLYVKCWFMFTLNKVNDK